MDEKHILERNEKILKELETLESSNSGKSPEELRKLADEIFQGQPNGDTHLLPDNFKEVGEAILKGEENYKPPELTEI